MLQPGRGALFAHLWASQGVYTHVDWSWAVHLDRKELKAILGGDDSDTPTCSY